MTRMPMSAAAGGLLRALLARAGEERNRILLTELRSTDWQSLTYTGERHEIRLRIAGPRAGELLEWLTAGLADAEFSVPGQIVADVAVAGRPVDGPDGSIALAIEALTISE